MICISKKDGIACNSYKREDVTEQRNRILCQSQKCIQTDNRSARIQLDFKMKLTEQTGDKRHSEPENKGRTDTSFGYIISINLKLI